MRTFFACLAFGTIILAPWMVIFGAILAVCLPNGLPGVLLLLLGFALGANAVVYLDDHFSGRI